MDVPSTSRSGHDGLDDGAFSIYNEMATLESALEFNEDTSDPYAELLGLVDAQVEFCDQLLDIIAKKRKQLAEKKAWLEKKLDHERGLDHLARNKVPVIQYLPPYFKDENMMCPPQNEEAKHKLQYTTFDPLTKEDKKWSPAELRLLREAVKNSVIQAGIQKFVDRKDILRSKLQRAGVDSDPEEVQAWKDEIELLDRKIKHSRDGQVDSSQVDLVDYSCVDWLKISTVEFKGSRSAAALRYKWLNEQCPRWNSGPWTKEELAKLKQLREDPSFTSWAAVAKKLQTQRSPYQCFEKYRSDMYRVSKDWTKEEDDRLIALVKVMTVNGVVQWDKVTFYMPGRHRQQVRTRYQRTLDENVRHGRWTDHEDLLLMTAVARFGAKDWAKVAKAVVGRSDGQCRERWCNVLEKCTYNANDWSPEEDERLVLGVQVFGRGQWAKIAEILPRHNPASIHDRYHSLLTAKMRLCSARLIGYPTEYRSAVQTSVHKARRDVLRQQLTEDELKAQCYRAAKEQAEKVRAETPRAKKWQNKTLTEEEKATIEKGIEEIAEKFRNGESAPDVKELFKKIHLTDKEISAIIAAAKRRNVNNFNSGRKYPRAGKAPVKKIKKNIYLQPDSVYERADFEPYETEDERIMIMTESLCHAVRKYDHYEWCNRYTEDRIRPESVAATFASNLLNVRCVDVAARLRHCEQFPIDLTLPPTFSTASAYRVFESSRVSLSKRASVYFNPSDVNSTDFMILYPEGDIVRKFTIHDRLNIQLHSDILLDLNYLKLKTQVRAVFLEPTRLAMAIESPEAEEQRNKVQMELMGTIMAEHEASQTEAMLDYVASEVVVENTQENEPIFYEDAVDDALNATIHTVMDKIRSDEPVKKKRGRRTNRDRWLAEYLALEQGLDEPVKKRHLPPRRARNDPLAPDLVTARSSDDSDEVEVDVVGSSSTDAHIGDAVSPSLEAGLECASTTAERDIQESEALLEAKAEPVKRKRGRPRKYEAPPTSKENQERSGAKKRKSVHEVSDEGEEEL
ncbi:hypothetical protein V3C99_002907 [Haemonchus contortus]